MASRRAGYFRGGEAEAKPLPPLRERICPAIKQLEEIDSLQRELDREYTVPNKRTGKTMDPDEYFRLMHVLEKRRDRIERLEARANGVEYSNSDDVAPELPAFEWPRPSWPDMPQLSTRQKKLLFIVAALAFCFIQSHFFA
jgi:hypothetical protein